MKFEDYCIAAPKTLKYRETLEDDLDHMLIGMCSEFNELQEALAKTDTIEIMEELGDLFWYTVVYAVRKNIQLFVLTDIRNYSLEDIVNRVSKLVNYHKRQVIYKKEQSEQLEAYLLQNIFHALCNFAYPHYLDTKSASLGEVWGRNIAKLNKVRYKDGVYSDEAANNRDLEAERKELEKKI